VELALIDGFNTLAIDTWLQVIPQLIARINSPISAVRRLLHQLLIRVGKEHPQALVFPLTVASKNQSAARTNAARLILEKMRQQASAALVDQALLVSQELIRVAILWHELWHEGLEDASRFYFGEHNVEGMFDTLAPLHQLLEKGPETQREASFQQAFGRDLQEAFEWCKKYTRSGKVNDLNRAWDLYYHAFRRLNKMLPLMKTLELKSCSPKLLEARDLELAVPGTYKAGKPVVRIAFFQPVLKIYPTKQRPRKLAIVGSDGQVYYFLLKGHEDLRQDERVMQLFGLINALFKGGGKANDTRLATRKSLANLSITRYAVIPLSPKSGLIGWVPHCDTLHELIREYRQARNILLNLEHRLMLQMSSDYDNLSLIQKVEVFEYALENTNGMDIERVLWLKSPNRETWLERRINYTRSLAVMSMVGYILGLGDRHPSNLMLDRHTGKVIHIDFGDCFEVAMQREKYPEKIPFRLTRMLINAMEVCGIEGLFRATCETVMTVLRENKESLMAVLEAFVHDPLINWWLLTTNAPPPQTRDQTRVQEEYNSHVSSKFSPRSHSQHVEKNSKQQRAGESDMFDEDNRDGADGDDIDNDTYRQDEESIKPQPDSHSQLPAQKQGHDKYLSRCPTVQPQALAQTSSNVGKKDSAERISHGQSLHSQLQDQSAATTTIVKGGTTTTESTTSSNDTDSLSLSETPTPNPQVKPHITTNVNAAATGGAAAEEGGAGEQQILNQRAVAVINRVSNKLSGRDFNTEGPISVPEQVERLIQQATSHDNLCQCYIGWCPFW
jgi:FKBP12-rapamycin complex-associated protein